MRYSGAFVVRWTLLTPLALPPEDRTPAPPEDHAELQGSSVKGAVRSLHETLFGGCLRVVDPDFVPSYRAPATGKRPEWTLAQVVETTTGGVPTKVRLAEAVEWVDGPSLARAYRQAREREVPTAGDVFAIESEPEETTLGRIEIRSVGRLFRRSRPRRAIETHTSGRSLLRIAEDSPVGDRILLVTDVRVRRPVRNNGTRGRALWACGVLTDMDRPIKDEVAAAFRRACEGADDLRRLQSARGPSNRADNRRHAGAHAPIDPADGRPRDWRSETVAEDVRWWADYDGPPQGPRVVIGRRHLTTGLLFPGDVVWVRTSAGNREVEQIDLAEIWRETGAGKVAERVPQEALPCRFPRAGDRPVGDVSLTGLCLSCEIFGAADDRRSSGHDGNSRGGAQTAYAGHVRFGTARPVTPVRIQQADLAPTGTPHLGVGMFLLAQPRTLDSRGHRNEFPGRWGAFPDGYGLRQLRGRKFYWHSDPQAQADYWSSALGRKVTPRHLRRSGQKCRPGPPCGATSSGGQPRRGREAATDGAGADDHRRRHCRRCPPQPDSRCSTAADPRSAQAICRVCDPSRWR